MPMLDVVYRPMRYTVALDNHEPPRRVAYSEALEYVHPVTGVDGIKITDHRDFSDAESAVFIVDDGKTVVPYYCAGWRYEAGYCGLTPWEDLAEPREYVLLQPFPTNAGGRARSDDGRVVDFSTWMLGPKRAYHLKVTR